MKQKPQPQEKLSKIHHLFDHGILHHFSMAVMLLYLLTLTVFTGAVNTPTSELWLFWTDVLFTAVFAVEVIVKLIAHPKDFFSRKWNLFDLVILILTVFFPQVKVLRLFRLFFYITVFVPLPFLHRVIHTFIHSIPTIAGSAVALGVVLYAYGLIFTVVFAEKLPEFFGNVGRSLFTLFQVITLEGWAMEVARPAMAIHSWAWILFVSLIVVASFGVMNIFIGAIVNSMQAVDESQFDKASIDDLQRDLNEIKQLLNKK